MRLSNRPGLHSLERTQPGFGSRLVWSVLYTPSPAVEDSSVQSEPPPACSYHRGPSFSLFEQIRFDFVQIQTIYLAPILAVEWPAEFHFLMPSFPAIQSVTKSIILPQKAGSGQFLEPDHQPLNLSGCVCLPSYTFCNWIFSLVKLGW